MSCPDLIWYNTLHYNVCCFDSFAENMIHANAHKQAGDPEVEQNVRGLFEILMKNFREFSGFDRWETEVNNGNMHWGITHTEKFWRENAKLVEKDDFKLLKRLIALLHCEDSDEVVAVALYDLGEFTRFYPNGRGVVKTLGGKDTAMELIGSQNPVCISFMSPEMSLPAAPLSLICLSVTCEMCTPPHVIYSNIYPFIVMVTGDRETSAAVHQQGHGHELGIHEINCEKGTPNIYLITI